VSPDGCPATSRRHATIRGRSVGRSVSKNLTVSLELGAPIIKDYPVYDFKTITRINMRF
jgi:hypothetical protein